MQHDHCLFGKVKLLGHYTCFQNNFIINQYLYQYTYFLSQKKKNRQPFPKNVYFCHENGIPGNQCLSYVLVRPKKEMLLNSFRKDLNKKIPTIDDFFSNGCRQRFVFD